MTDRLLLDATPDSPRRARAFLRDRLGRWGYGALVDTAALLTSELVTNAVLHSRRPFELTVDDLRDGVVVSVDDAEPSPAVRRQVDEAEVGGRGLAIVHELASAWGVSSIPDDGKIVWFRMNIA